MKNHVYLILILSIFILVCSGSTYGANPTKAHNYGSSLSNIYVNSASGNDSYDGSSPTYTGGTSGPLKTINKSISTVTTNGIINLAAGTYQESGLSINKNLSINGAGSDNTTVDGNNANTIFHIQSGAFVTIQNIFIKNGRGNSNGGAIYNEGTLTLNYCEIGYNQAKSGKDAKGSDDSTAGGNGGAIYNTNKGNLTISNCYIHDNQAGRGGDGSPKVDDHGQSSHGGNGGAIYNAGILTIHGCDIESNSAGNGGSGSDVHDGASGGSGGAIYNDNSASLTIDSNSYFHDNKAGNGGKNVDASEGGDGGNGGAIYNNNNAGTVNITDSQFNHNYAGNGADVGDGGNGGAIYNKGHIYIENCSLTQNYAGNGGDATGSHTGKQGGSGGALYNYENAFLTIDNSYFEWNVAGTGGNPSGDHDGGAGGNGGAVYNDGTLTIQNNCDFDTNSAGKGSNSYLTQKGGKGGDGGAVYTTYKGTITNTTFENNTTGNGGDATDSINGKAGGNGGAVCNTGTLTITNCTFTSNKGGKGGSVGEKPLSALSGGNGGNGGAIYNNEDSTLTINNSVFTRNEAGNGGDNGDFTSNPGDGGNGGAIYNDGTLNIGNNTVLTNNKAGLGGAVLQFNEYKVNLPCGNGGNGGAIYNDQDGNLNINDTVITKNKAALAGYKHSAGNGGAIYNKGSFNISECDISNNMAGVDILNGPSGKTIKHGVGNAIYSDSKNKIIVNFSCILSNKTLYITSANKPKVYMDAVYLNSYSSSNINLQNNWWGTNNNNATISKLVLGSGNLTSYYTPYLKLTVGASPAIVNINGTSTVTANLRMNSANQNTYTQYNKSIPDDVKITFRAYNGSLSIKNTTTKDGMATTTFTANKSSGAAFVTIRADDQLLKTLITVKKPSVTLAQIIYASNKVKSYYIAHGTLPSSIKIGKHTLNMAEFLLLLVRATTNINNHNTKSISIIKVKSATKPSGTYISGHLTKIEYLKTAKDIKNFINTNGRAPNYAITALGKIQFSKLVMIYSKLMSFYGGHNRLPTMI